MRLPPGTTEIEITSEELFIKVISEPHLCMLLNRNLTPNQIDNLKTRFHIVQVEHEGEWYEAAVLGYYKPKMPLSPERLKEREAAIFDFWNS